MDKDCTSTNIGDMSVHSTLSGCTERCVDSPDNCMGGVYRPSSQKCWIKNKCDAQHIITNEGLQYFALCQGLWLLSKVEKKKFCFCFICEISLQQF